jgi:hypothetical protein
VFTIFLGLTSDAFCPWQIPTQEELRFEIEQQKRFFFEQHSEED